MNTEGSERDVQAETGPAPRVSIAIPVYNGANFLTEAANSVLRQTFTDLELIIVDNASTDETPEICRALVAKDPRVRYYRNEKNLGAAPNYNRGFELSRGTYLKWLAHDDWLSDNYIEECVKVLDRYPDVVLAHGTAREMIDPETPFIDSEFTVPLWGTAGPVERHAMAMSMPRTCHAIFGLMRRDQLERTTLHRPYYSSDCNLVAEIALLGRFLCVPEAIFYNRRHQGQSMAQSKNFEFLNVWQDSSNTKPICSIHTDRLRHAWEIWGRYPQIASRSRLLKACAGFMLSPRKLIRYADELVWSIMPRLYPPVRRVLRTVLRTLKPLKPYIQPTPENAGVAARPAQHETADEMGAAELAAPAKQSVVPSKVESPGKRDMAET